MSTFRELLTLAMHELQPVTPIQQLYSLEGVFNKFVSKYGTHLKMTADESSALKSMYDELAGAVSSIEEYDLALSTPIGQEAGTTIWMDYSILDKEVINECPPTTGYVVGTWRLNRMSVPRYWIDTRQKFKCVLMVLLLRAMLQLVQGPTVSRTGVGLWRSPEGETEIDLVVHVENEQHARQFASAFNQKAIFDVAAQRSIFLESQPAVQTQETK